MVIKKLDLFGKGKAGLDHVPFCWQTYVLAEVDRYACSLCDPPRNCSMCAAKSGLLTKQSVFARSVRLELKLSLDNVGSLIQDVQEVGSRHRLNVELAQ